MSQNQSSSRSEADTDVLIRRVVAVGIDTIVLALIVIGVGALLLPIPTWQILALTAVMQFSYFWLFEGLFGLTPGKRLTGIKVCKQDGSSVGFRASLVRNAVRFVDSALAYLVGFAFLIRSNENQRLGDRHADTIVVKR